MIEANLFFTKQPELQTNSTSKSLIPSPFTSKYSLSDLVIVLRRIGHWIF